MLPSFGTIVPNVEPLIYLCHWCLISPILQTSLSYTFKGSQVGLNPPWVQKQDSLPSAFLSPVQYFDESRNMFHGLTGCNIIQRNKILLSRREKGKFLGLSWQMSTWRPIIIMHVQEMFTKPYVKLQYSLMEEYWGFFLPLEIDFNF